MAALDVLRMTAGMMLILAAASKLLHLRTFAWTLSALGVNGLARNVLSALLPTIEFAAGAGLVAAAFWPLPAVGGLLLSLGFILAVVYAVATERQVPCACFGATTHELGSRNLLTATFLGAVSAASMASRTPVSPWNTTLSETIGEIILAALLLLFGSLLLATRSLLSLAKQRRETRDTEWEKLDVA